MKQLLAALALCLLSACSGGKRSSDGPDGSEAETDTGTGPEVDTDFPSGAIPKTCQEAQENPTSVGCEFFMADLDQGNQDDLDLMPYAVVVSNPHTDKTVAITLSQGSIGELLNGQLQPGELRVIEVSCDVGCLVAPSEIEIQGTSTGAGFRLVSEYPVSAYQWNPYGTDTASTDASLLLPTTSLGTSYIVAAWGNGPDGDFPSFLSQTTIVATEEDTLISLTPSVDVHHLNGLGPYAAGVEIQIPSLSVHDVLTLSPATFGEDLTGSAIRSNKPIVVFGGHTGARVPSSEYSACDHVEEQLLPLSAWGTSTVLARHAPREDCLSEDLTVWRIVAGVADMKVVFDPPAPPPANEEYFFAEQGEVLEFMAPGDYFVKGLREQPSSSSQQEAPFLAYQMMTGASFANCLVDGPDTGTMGDPMMLQAAPAGQYLDRYVFTTDNVFDFRFDHIIVVRPKGSLVALDCKGLIPDSEFTDVGDTLWQVARIFIDDPDDTTGCQDGPHLLTADAPVGLSVVGTARANSYGYLGGVGVKNINPTLE